MTRLQLSLAAAVTAIAVCPTAGSALSTDVPVYQGTAFVTAVTSACTTNGVAIGNYATMIYRQQPRPKITAYGGAIQFVSGRSAVSYVMPASTALNGGETNLASVNAYGELSLVGPYSFTGGFDLTISDPTGPAPGVTITGTVSNLWGYAGCTATIEASLALRP